MARRLRAKGTKVKFEYFGVFSATHVDINCFWFNYTSVCTLIGNKICLRRTPLYFPTLLELIRYFSNLKKRQLIAQMGRTKIVWPFKVSAMLV